MRSQKTPFFSRDGAPYWTRHYILQGASYIFAHLSYPIWAICDDFRQKWQYTVIARNRYGLWMADDPIEPEGIEEFADNRRWFCLNVSTTYTIPQACLPSRGQFANKRIEEKNGRFTQASYFMWDIIFLADCTTECTSMPPVIFVNFIPFWSIYVSLKKLCDF